MDKKIKQRADDIIRSKSLSVVVTGRNDNYMGNFKYRITTCLNYLARNLKDIGRLDDIEVLVTDWGSDVPLAKVLSLSPEAGRICRFVYVHPTIARAVRPDGDFCPSRAINASLRRGKGEFLMLFDADSLFPRHSLQSLLDLLDGKLAVPFDVNRMFFFFCRYHVPWEIVQREPTIEEWDRYLLLNIGSLPRSEGLPGLGISGAGQMMHRSIWHACRGYNQQLVGQAWIDAEYTLRVTQRYPWMDLSSIGVSLFHMAHWPRNRQGIWPNAVINPHVVSPTMQVNDENWGLANYELDIQMAENIVESSKTTKSSGTISQVEPWNKTRGELVAELTSRLVRKHARKNIQRLDVVRVEWDSLCALSWYSLYYYPRAYLEFGIQSGAAAVVAAACPGVEIYGIDSWQASDGRRPVRSPDCAIGILRRVGYRGYTRLVSGDPCTAFRRLRESSVGTFSLDLALLRGDMFSKDVTQQLSDLIPHLAPGGMVVFTCASRDSFQRVWSEMQAKFPQFAYLLCKTGKTGLILAASLQNEDSSALSDAKNDLRVSFGKLPILVIQLRRVSRQVCRMYRALRNPSRYPEYAKRICRSFLRSS